MTAWVAGLAILHALRVADFRRREYRFPVPVPFRLEEEEAPGACVMLVTDVSPAGCRLSGPELQALRVGDVLRGRLILPGGEVRVQATVKSSENAGAAVSGVARSVGCEFIWSSAEDRTNLELFLYGSDLQWRFNGLKERVATPLEWFANRLKQPMGSVSYRLSQHWIPLLYGISPATGRTGVGYLSPPDAAGAERRLISLEEFPNGARVAAEELTPEGLHRVDGQLFRIDASDMPIAPMQVYRWTT
jgi:hypothetical protein